MRDTRRTSGRMVALALAALAAAAVALGACGGSRELSEQERAFVELVAPTTENLLTALSEGDEAGYTRDMESRMKAASSGTAFAQVYESIIGKIGKYVSAEATRVSQQSGYQVVQYDARFEQEEHVTVRVVYDVSGEKPLVSGLWLDSPLGRGEFLAPA